MTYNIYNTHIETVNLKANDILTSNKHSVLYTKRTKVNNMIVEEFRPYINCKLQPNTLFTLANAINWIKDMDIKLN